jgi:hypothetical protein
VLKNFCRSLCLPIVLCVAGCGSGSSSSSSTQTTPGLTLSSTALSFAVTAIGSSSAAQTVTLTNNGTASLTLVSVVLSDTADYALTNPCGASLAAGANCILSVAFRPQTNSTFPATITVTDNASGSPQVITLTGSGMGGAFNPASYTFPNTAIGSTSTNATIYFTDIGTSALSISSIVLTGTGASAFTQTNNCPATLAAGVSCTFVVNYVPTAANVTSSAALSVTDNSGNGAGTVQTMALTGTSTAAVNGPIAVLVPGSVTFASTTVNTSAGAQIVTLSNTGNAALTGIAASISGGSTSSAFTDTTTCTATLAAGSACSISVNFTPTAVGTYLAYLNVADNATGSPQQVTLNGTAVAVPTAQALLSTNSISFPTTQVGKTSASYDVTLSNPGGATLTGIGISLGGTNSIDFAESTTCGSTLAAGASCSISATFTPAAASSYMATISVASSATTQPQTIVLSGTGSTSAVNYQFLVFPESDNSVTPLYAFINEARSTIDMTMYEMQDTTFTADLVAQCKNGVRVRVIFSQSVASSSATAYSALNSAGSNCSAVDSNSAFTNTHQKTITIDGALPTAQTAILSLNLQQQYYSTTRDFAMIENDPADIAAIEATFNQDYAAGGTKNTTEFAYQPPPGDDLIWSPTTATADMLGIINAATKTIILENEEMSAGNIVTALENACQRGVVVHIAMVANSEYTANFNALTAAGCGVYLYPDTANGFYVHAKAVVADYGLATQNVYMGSINYSTASLTENRELGMYITDPASVKTLYTTMTQDYTGNPVY